MNIKNLPKFHFDKSFFILHWYENLSNNYPVRDFMLVEKHISPQIGVP